MNAPSVAIVGSGPSACYLAQALRKQWADAPIVMIERLPAPFGLVRYGVAPDHQGTKAVCRQFERLFERERVDFLGNLEIGRDLSLEQLREAFDLVVLATGLYGDRRLDIPGETLEGVYGAGQLTRLLNGHPDEQGFTPRLGRRVAVIGNGNVAIDVLRLLAKSASDFEGSDIADDALRALLAEGVERIDIIGRSPAAQARFDPVMLRELGKLAGVRLRVEDLPPAHYQSTDATELARLEVLRGLASQEQPATGRELVFRFGWTPQAILGKDRVEALQLRRVDGHELRLELDSLVSAIGFEEAANAALRRDALRGAGVDLDAGRLDAGLYCVGWLRRGPRGTIPENRQDARLVAETMIVDQQTAPRSGRAGLAALPGGLLADAVSYADWKRIDHAETQAAAPGRVRRKITDRAGMLAIARSPLENPA
ncbi:FAD-dependent oxidoreductase [Pseudomonas sp. ZM23]|uniref:FAD-dependent oxidoreductase n=1 Tax=Pseudomonas triclosanedens TaxID=2961893 RepID=A0ABY7A401_9PSED|nr:FAD-dependent oxidoreductase [Pseudomonas triclosanedens]MCP8464948.1 FAD-dependent oxidoreductase [Pseudomonas triclosanedens]MCP8470340.1 FAD-dependent oxidoreductase [Pseudomonas triclosanedens]MCP8476145.1 FAD-dependent oxidoreductase [Pseudomonas triclosanedens]WAI51622.1 FAD-dependent oxidoreductase [Pseudomonas triclosanedens]